MSGLLAQRYAVERRRGAGPVGAVYRAIDQWTGQTVAVKVLHPQAAGNARLRAAFSARIAGASSALLPVFDSGEADGRLYRVTPYVEGPNLAEWLAARREPPGKEHLAALVSQIAATMDGSVHGNLKPTNILLERGGRVCLSDVGLPATPGPYTAPEVAAGGAPTPQADVYSLAIILRAIARGDLPPGVQKALSHAAQPDPQRRYPTLSAFAAAWQAALKGQPVPSPARPVTAPDSGRLLVSAAIFAAVVVFVLVLGAILLLASSGGVPVTGSQLQAATATATSLNVLLPTPTPYQRPTMPPTWTPIPVEVATKTPAPTATLAPTLFPTFSPAQLALTYWEGDGYDYTMWDAQLAENAYGRFDLFPINVWMGGYNGVVPTEEQEWALQNALDQINQVVPITRVQQRLFAHLTIWLMNNADFRANAACGADHDYAAACALPTYTEAGILLVTIWLDAADGCFTETLLHEMTHGLGIVVHSPYPEDIMYYAQTCDKTNYTERDLATLRLLYSAPAFHPAVD